MKKVLTSNHLCAGSLLTGGVLLTLRRMLYQTAVDEKNLLVMSHPLEIGMLAVAAVWTACLLLAVWKLDGSGRYADNFSKSIVSGAGHALAAAAIALTVLSGEGMPGLLGQFWKIAGLAAAVCLCLAGFRRLRGRAPFFLTYGAVSLFCILHIVNQYRLWSGNPQLQDYVFDMAGVMLLALFGYYSAGFCIDAGQRRMQLGNGLLAVVFCTAALSGSAYPWLYLGGAVWALTGLCAFHPAATAQQESE